MEDSTLKINRAMEAVREELSGELLESVMREEKWHRLMGDMADRINTRALEAKSESDIAFAVDHLLVTLSEQVLVPAGCDGYTSFRERKIELENCEDNETKFHPLHKRGRIDSKYASVIIEYKHTTRYKSAADVERAAEQAARYLRALDAREPGEYAALVTDGLRCQFLELSGGELRPGPVENFDGHALDRLVRSIIRLTVKALDAENLIHDLVTVQRDGENRIHAMTKAIHRSLDQMCPETRVLYESWLDNFGLSHDDASQQQAIEERRRDLAAIVGKQEIESREEYRILFALQTATAVVGMLIAYKVVSVIRGGKSEYALGKLHNLGKKMLQAELGRMANGSLSSEIRICNLLELNCFTWVFLPGQWSEEIYTAVNDVIAVLLQYENMPDLASRPDDLFRDLYLAILPTSVRHAMGEYYTPSWLADQVIREGLRHLDWRNLERARVLDSAAGSGTFPQRVIHWKREKYRDLERGEQLRRILDEVASVDANILAVILARINYFISIADLITPEQQLYIPVYIGDSTVSIRDRTTEDRRFYTDTMTDAQGNAIVLRMPLHALEDREKFICTLRFMGDLSDKPDEQIAGQLAQLCSEEELREIRGEWLDLRARGMLNSSVLSGIINDFLLCALGRFDLVVGNPPWVDWKSLPSVHREKIKSACISRKLFSGDGRTGGINLNVCALLTNITAENWLKEDGVMAVLMPQNLLFQQSYEGYRNLYLADGRRLYFQEIVDWSRAGHPFYPVQQLFCTYVMAGEERDYFRGIPYREVVLNRGEKLERMGNRISEETFSGYFTVLEKVIGRTASQRTAFTVAASAEELREIQTISGGTGYLGREGVEYYPQELQLFQLTAADRARGTVELRTYKNPRSKYSIGVRTPVIETTYLRPLVKGICISRFHVEPSEYLVAFPYDRSHCKIPLDRQELNQKSPLLYQYYRENRAYLEMQTDYSDSIIGSREAEYYALARTGPYSHAPWYVVFRDNTKWVAAVIGAVETSWGGRKIPAFQNHCVSICERPDGAFITEDEAHYICGILNTHLVEAFILATSDKRTFKVRLPVKLPLFDAENRVHKRIAKLSREAHAHYQEAERVEKLRTEIDKLYLQALRGQET